MKLIGYSSKERQELNSIEETAKFIIKHGRYEDVEITTENGIPFISTFGIYINRIADMNYREELLKILIPMQQKSEAEALGAYEDECNEEDIAADTEEISEDTSGISIQ